MKTREQTSADKNSAGRYDHRATANEMKLRILAAAAVLVSAAVHLYLWFDVFRHAHVIGPAFMLNVVGGTIIAVLLVTWRHWIPLLLAVGFGASTLGAFIIATTAGLYGVHEHWTGCRCGRLRRARSSRSWRPGRCCFRRTRCVPRNSSNPRRRRRTHHAGFVVARDMALP